VCAAVLAAAAVVEARLFGREGHSVWRLLGLSRPTGRSMIAATVICVLLLAFHAGFALATGARPKLIAGWLWLLVGMLAQGGIAEERVFRGLLFGRLRQGRRFWRAVALSLPPFVAVHLLLFFTLPIPVAIAATLLSLISAAPLSRLYDLGHQSVWAPALVHGVMQAGIKLVEYPPEHAQGAAIGWMAVCAAVPWLAFALRVRG
jgi:membrane protease YdiL (CAAX protease family)